MTPCCIAFPVLPGKRDALIAFANTVMGERLPEYDKSQATVLQESWFLQPTPMGDLCLVHFIAEDPAAVFTNLGASEEPFDVWFRNQISDITGMDMTQPLPGLPPQIFSWARK